MFNRFVQGLGLISGVASHDGRNFSDAELRTVLPHSTRLSGQTVVLPRTMGHNTAGPLRISSAREAPRYLMLGGEGEFTSLGELPEPPATTPGAAVHAVPHSGIYATSGRSWWYDASWERPKLSELRF